MSRYGGLSFTKTSASDKQNDDSTNSKPSMMQSAIYNEYSDLEDQEDEEMDEGNTNQYARANGQPSDTTSSMNKYGIGATLLRKMGYQEGQGLGAKREGIVKPIEPTIRIGKQGIGADKTNESRKRTYDADEEVIDFQDQTSLRFSRVSTGLFTLITSLENLQLDIPQKIKQVSNKLNEGDLDLMNEAENLSKSLKEIYDDWSKVCNKENLLKLQLNELDSVNASTNLEKLEEIKEKLTQYLENSISEDEFLNYLVSDSIIDQPLSQSLFLSVIKKDLDYINEISLNDISKQEQVIIPRLRDLSSKFMIFKSTSNSLDLLIYDLYSRKFKYHLTQKTFLEEIVVLLSMWLENPIFAEQNVILDKLANEIFAPYLYDEISTLDLDKEKIPSFVEDWFLIFSSDSSDLGYLYDSFEVLLKKFEDFFNIDIQNSMWDNVDDNLPFMKLQLKDYKETWLPFIAKSSPRRSTSLEKVFLRSLYHWSNQIDFDIMDSSQLDLCFELIKYIDNEDYLLNFLQFGLFNPWTKALYQQKNIAQWYSYWYNYFTGKLANELKNNMVFNDVISWYLSLGISIISLNLNEDYLTKLPQIDHSTSPSIEQIFNINDSETGVNGVPSSQLNISFKDVIADYCLTHAILLTNLKQMHNSKGVPIYSFEKHKLVHGYIEDDVLYICKQNEDYLNSLEYEPIYFDKLIDYLT